MQEMKRKRKFNRKTPSQKRAPALKKQRFKPEYHTTAVEKKFLDTTLTGIECSSNGAVALCLTHLNAIPQDSTVSGRDGAKVTMKSVDINIMLSQPVADAAPSACRVIVIYDAFPNGAATLPTIASILTSQNGRGFMNLDNRKRYTVLMNDMFVVGPVATNLTGVMYDRRLLLDHDVIFNNSAATGAIATVQEGALYLLTCGSKATTLAPSINGFCRVRFVDP